MIPPNFSKFNQFDVYAMSEEEVRPLLWKPQMLELWQYGILTECNIETANRWLYGHPFNWLTFTFFLKGAKRIKGRTEPDLSKPSNASLHLHSLDDGSVTAFLEEMSYVEFYPTWEKILQFMRDMDFVTQTLDAELLMDFCSHNLKVRKFDFN